MFMIKIAFLRALNVGKTNRIKMEELKFLFTEIGFSNIVYYLQSGNILFDTNIDSNPNLELMIEKYIQKKFSLNISVVVRTPDELHVMFTNSLLCKQYLPENLIVTFFKIMPNNNEMEKLNKIDRGEDKFEILGRDLLVFCKGKYHKSKLNNSIIENKLKTIATSRKLSTINKLLEMLE